MSTQVSLAFLYSSPQLLSLATRGHLRPELCLCCGLMNPEQIRAQRALQKRNDGIQSMPRSLVSWRKRNEFVLH